MPSTPASWRQRLRRILRPAWLGTIRRTSPLSRHWGEDRGTPVDRYYIERFLDAHRADITGRVLEVKDSAYTRRFGHDVSVAEVLDADARNPQATVIADLTAADGVPGNSYDCFILTQTLQLIYDTRAALRHSWRVLRPGGVLLATVPVVSRVLPEVDFLRDYWRFTGPSCSALFGDQFGAAQIAVRARGNVLSSIAFLAGMAHEELSTRELDTDDPAFPLLVTVRAVKAGPAR